MKPVLHLAICALLSSTLLACSADDTPVDPGVAEGSAEAGGLPDPEPAPPGASPLDLALRAAVLGQFAADPGIDGTEFRAVVIEGVLTLETTTNDPVAWERARTLAGQVEGVTQVLMSTPAPGAPAAPEGSGAALDAPAVVELEEAFAMAAELGTRSEEALELPTAGEGSGAPIALSASGDRPRTYVVQAGDNLSLIASKTLGDGLAWQSIYELNRNVIGANPQALQAGMELRIPQD